MKKKFLIFFLLILNNCSFDNKTGIWKDASVINLKNKELSKKENLKKIFLIDELFKEEIRAPNKINLKLSKPLKNKNWYDIYLNKTNNIPNFKYQNNNKLIYKSRKLTKNHIGNDILFIDDNLIYNDEKGFIYVHSLKNGQTIFKYSFYKKKLKKYKKDLSLYVFENNIIVADNFGYIYSLDFSNNKLNWAHNYGIPFRSNIKISNNVIFLANEDNTLYALNIFNGKKLWDFATEPSLLKSSFKNNLVLDQKNNLYLLNTNGNFHSINTVSRNINWILNFNQISRSETSDIFNSSPVVINNETFLVSTDKSISLHNNLTGFEYWKHNIAIKEGLYPLISEDLLYLFTKQNFLICIGMSDGKILWSSKILSNSKKSKDKLIKKKVGDINFMYLVNTKILLFTNKNLIIQVDPKSSDINSIKKLPFKKKYISVKFINGDMFLVSAKNQLFKFN